MRHLLELLAQGVAWWNGREYAHARICYLIGSHFSTSRAIGAALAEIPDTFSDPADAYVLTVPFYGNMGHFCAQCLKILQKSPVILNYRERMDEFGEYSVSFFLPREELQDFVHSHELIDEEFYLTQYSPEGSCIEDYCAHFPNRKPAPWYDLALEPPDGRDPLPGIWTFKQAKLSVLMPVFNNFDYLDECYHSIRQQSLGDLEIIIINDGSTDQRVLGRLAEYRASDPRVRIINKPNSGYGHSMSCGLLASNGEYIGIVEADDYIAPRMFETLYAAAASKTDIVKGHYYYFTDRDGRREAVAKKVAFPPSGSDFAAGNRLAWFQGNILIQGAIYRRRFIIDNEIFFNPSPRAAYQDIGFYMLTSFYAASITLVNDHMYYLRRDNAASSVSVTGNVHAPVGEYARIKKYLDRDPGLEARFHDYYMLRKFKSYRFTAKRIDPIYLPDFMRHFAREWQEEGGSDNLLNQQERQWLKENLEPFLK